jgi:hypothetical protein
LRSITEERRNWQRTDEIDTCVRGREGGRERERSGDAVMSVIEGERESMARGRRNQLTLGYDTRKEGERKKLS